ncbi:protein of unknown function [Taphrina deformans PYCC 5710]|uniref:Uncharacterized protein n=1 Tax=Taphrina deformans (strain PYCC 5710 / ATCC 11124 / CBS 356.35 / IMI 108563 / JCM 9778 / NBRC 8474) TaxID=1097556 RepID=R4XPG3_TAPDE|nr:protein of unknown function [Taphrina deformans PYCC 5710]|eukprot:CCG85116.1 protein of unknown function [Taphrina deformans PYCC 5710]
MAALTTQNVYSGTFQSPVACFLVATMIDVRSGTIKAANQCTPLWAQMTFTLRLFFVSNFHLRHSPKNSFEIEDNTIVLDQILEDILHNEHQKYLTTGASCKGIFGWIAVSVYQGQLLKNNGSKDLSLQLISGDIKDGLIIDGTPVHLCDWSTMLLNQISELEEFFTSHLTFGEYSLSADILAIYDTTKPMRENFSFLDWPENEKLKLHRAYGELLAFWVSAVSECHKQKVHELLKINHTDQSLSFFKAGIQEYAKSRSVFLKALAPLLHLTSASADFLAKQLQLTQEMNRATLEAEETVEAQRAGNGERLPWLEHLGFSVHLHGLARHKIVSSYGKPSPLEPGYKAMVALGEISTAILEETLKWCQDGRDCRMTRPMAVSLTQFAQAHKEVDGKFRGFYTKLEPATVKKYFAQWQGLGLLLL